MIVTAAGEIEAPANAFRHVPPSWARSVVVSPFAGSFSPVSENRGWRRNADYISFELQQGLEGSGDVSGALYTEFDGGVELDRKSVV